MRLTGRHLTVYGQQEVVKDLIAAWLRRNGDLRFEVANVAVHGIETDAPRITWDGGELACDVVVGCDGFHGVCRAAIPEAVRMEREYTYPMAWLGVLAAAEPTTDELIYAWHERGFALYSMRSPTISRLYLQVPAGEDVGAWPDARIWSELQVRLATEGWRVGEGEILEKGITPMRSFVASDQHRPPAPRRRRRAHRPAHGGQGAQPRGQ